MFRFIMFISLFLNSCVSLAQSDLPFVDFTLATERPEFSLTDMKTGEAYDSQNHLGSAYVIEFYFAACPACNRNADNVKRLANAFKGNDKVQIVELSIDCQEAAYRTWIGNHSPIGPVLNGCDAAIVDTLNVSSFPTTYVYAPNKREAMRGVGVWSEATYTRIKRYLDQVR